MINYKIININDFPRRDHLEYFMSMEQPHVNITVEVDVTDWQKFCKREGVPFFLGFVHIVAQSAESIPEFRQRIHLLTDEELLMPEHAGYRMADGKAYELREYEECPTSHTESTSDERYCYCPLRHHMPFDEYIAVARRQQAEARALGSLEEDKEIEAFFFPTCVPWLRYTDVVHPMTDRFDSNPRFSWCKYAEDFRGRLMMPLTVAAHHGLVDGIHIAKFYENVEKNMNSIARHGNSGPF